MLATYIYQEQLNRQMLCSHLCTERTADWVSASCGVWNWLASVLVSAFYFDVIVFEIDLEMYFDGADSMRSFHHQLQTEWNDVVCRS